MLEDCSIDGLMLSALGSQLFGAEADDPVSAITANGSSLHGLLSIPGIPTLTVGQPSLTDSATQGLDLEGSL